MKDKKYHIIREHYLTKFRLHGACSAGVDWPDAANHQLRHKIMIDNCSNPTKHQTILDIGCGYGDFLDYIKEREIDFTYTGVDIGPDFIDHCKNKFDSVDFFCADILDNDLDLGCFDVVVLNGVFTIKNEIKNEDMLDFVCRMILAAWKFVDGVLVFNLMSSHVDWEREDLFHCPLDIIVSFLVKNLSRNIKIRMDYGLYEYSVFVYKEANR